MLLPSRCVGRSGYVAYIYVSQCYDPMTLNCLVCKYLTLKCAGRWSFCLAVWTGSSVLRSNIQVLFYFQLQSFQTSHFRICKAKLLEQAKFVRLNKNTKKEKTGGGAASLFWARFIFWPCMYFIIPTAIVSKTTYRSQSGHCIFTLQWWALSDYEL